VPLVGRAGGNLGSIEVARSGDVGFDQEDEDLLVQLAHMTSIAVENVVFSDAREANRLKDEFIAAVSHELRTPLNALRSWAWVLRQRQLDPEKAATVAEAIERSVTAQARIIDDLLDVSRIMTGKMSLRLEPLDLRPIVAAASDAFSAAADGQGVGFVRKIDGEPIMVSGDGDRLQQVVSNLISNAIKFTPKGGRVDVTLEHDGTNAVVRVSDTGCGIAPGFLPHVFERFRQADGAVTRRAGGLGVGLTIARQLVDMHGGSISAASPAKGRARRSRSCCRGCTTPARPRRPTRRPRRRPVRLDGVRILLVEDDVDTRNVMTLVLNDAGAAVVTAGSADEAMQALGAIRSTRSSATSAARRGRLLVHAARAHDGRVVPRPAGPGAVRVRAKRDKQRARDVGFDGHLAKPVDPVELLRTLTELLPARPAVDEPGARARRADRVT
jgi:CheY-like chemotaxis protein/anti-sigma regulatory factor (Ser/Thr protein kinase)